MTMSRRRARRALLYKKDFDTGMGDHGYTATSRAAVNTHTRIAEVRPQAPFPCMRDMHGRRTSQNRIGPTQAGGSRGAEGIQEESARLAEGEPGASGDVARAPSYRPMASGASSHPMRLS